MVCPSAHLQGKSPKHLLLFLALALLAIAVIEGVRSRPVLDSLIRLEATLEEFIIVAYSLGHFTLLLLLVGGRLLVLIVKVAGGWCAASEGVVPGGAHGPFIVRP